MSLKSDIQKKKEGRRQKVKGRGPGGDAKPASAAGRRGIWGRRAGEWRGYLWGDSSEPASPLAEGPGRRHASPEEARRRGGGGGGGRMTGRAGRRGRGQVPQ